MTVIIESFFDPTTELFSYVVADPTTLKAAIIDSLLDYDQYSGRTKTTSAEKIIAYVKGKKFELEWILETHIHADHLTASKFIQQHLGGKTAIGEHISEVLQYWVPIFNSSQDTPLDASQFDFLLHDQQIIKLGSIEIKVLHTPGHTPACVSYLIEDNIFVGDTLFMPDLGTARADFPGGNATALYDSINKIFALPDDTKIFLCHDYPPATRGPQNETSVKIQKKQNVFINSKTSKQDYIARRNARDQTLALPKLIIPSIQVNLRLGTFGNPEKNGIQYVKIPIDKL